MNKDLIETPRFNFFIGDEVLLKGKIVGFDVDENKCVENVVRLEYGQTLNVPNNNIYITDDIVDKSKIKVVVPQFVADWYEENKDSFEFNVWDWIAFRDEAKKSENREFNNWINNSRENPIQTLVNMHQFGYEVEEEKRYTVVTKATKQPLYYNAMDKKLFLSMGGLATKFTRKQLEEVGVGWVFDCPGIEIEEVE
ncbi:TPA: DUF1642 domain-containing protein [Streptococcus pneumoniae]